MLMTVMYRYNLVFRYWTQFYKPQPFGSLHMEHPLPPVAELGCRANLQLMDSMWGWPQKC